MALSRKRTLRPLETVSALRAPRFCTPLLTGVQLHLLLVNIALYIDIQAAHIVALPFQPSLEWIGVGFRCFEFRYGGIAAPLFDQRKRSAGNRCGTMAAAIGVDKQTQCEIAGHMSHGNLIVGIGEIISGDDTPDPGDVLGAHFIVAVRVQPVAARHLVEAVDRNHGLVVRAGGARRDA